MSREAIRDSSGRVLAYVSKDILGNKELKTSSGTLLARERDGVTKDSAGRVIAKGEGSLLAGLSRKK